MSQEREKLIKYKMYLESEKIRLAKKELHNLRIELERVKNKGKVRKR